MALASASLATQPLPGVDVKVLWAVPCQEFLCFGEDDGKSPKEGLEKLYPEGIWLREQPAPLEGCPSTQHDLFLI